MTTGARGLLLAAGWLGAALAGGCADAGHGKTEIIPLPAQEPGRVEPGELSDPLAAARGLLDAGDLRGAERAFQRAVDADPEQAPAYLGLARVRLAQGRLDEAVSLLRKARARAASTPALWETCGEELGRAYLALGEPENAMRAADRILARDESSATGRALRADALAAGALGSGAGQALQWIAERPRASGEEILLWARWLLEHDEPGRALHAAERVLAREPTDRAARTERARSLGSLGRADEAERELHDLLRADGTSAAVHLALAQLYLSLDRLPDAIHHATEGGLADPHDPEFASVRGQAWMRQGKIARARAAFEREAELRPDDARPWMSLGLLELEAGVAATAAECFARACALDPDSWTASYRLGQALSASGRPREAIEAYRACLAKNERVAEAHNNLAWLLADLDLDPVLAEVHAHRASQLAPDDPNVLGTLGWAQYKNHRLEDARASLERASREDPDDAMKRYMLAVVQSDLGRTPAARRHVEEALRLDPSFERSASARKLLARLGN